MITKEGAMFQNFTAQDWKIFFGNMLMLVTCLCYISWWTTAFRPGKSDSGIASVLIIATLAAGTAAIVVLSMGINGLNGCRVKIPVCYLVAAAAVLYVISFTITKTVFRRPVTSELLIIFVWAAIEFAVLDVLFSNGRLSGRAALVQSVLIATATCIGLVCYVLYYRLDESARYLDGLIPLASDGFVIAVSLTAEAIA